jgi:hypothetical protein
VSGLGAGPATQNPKLLVCDSDALFQLFITNIISPLKELKRLYGVQPVITQEVELELFSNQRYSKRVGPSVQKSISKGTLVVLSPHTLRSLIGPAAEVYYPAVQALGAQYRLRVQKGEAYSHATGVILKVPAMSNDFEAIRLLTTNECEVAAPTIRSFDLIVFAHHIGVLKDTDCDGFRKQMNMERNEYIPKEFRNASFKDGLPFFCPRILDGRTPPIGLDEIEPRPFKKRILVYRTDESQ